MNLEEIRWECYPHIASFQAARSFVERLALKGKRPKTVDSYARAIEDLLTYFCDNPAVFWRPMKRLVGTSPISNNVDPKSEEGEGG